MKEDFIFSYTEPWLDWYKEITVCVKDREFNYFTLEYRFSNSWFLIGNVLNKKTFHFEKKELGELREPYLKKFVEWAKLPFNGSKILEIRAISGQLNLIEAIKGEI